MVKGISLHRTPAQLQRSVSLARWSNRVPKVQQDPEFRYETSTDLCGHYPIMILITMSKCFWAGFDLPLLVSKRV